MNIDWDSEEIFWKQVVAFRTKMLAEGGISDSSYRDFVNELHERNILVHDGGVEIWVDGRKIDYFFRDGSPTMFSRREYAQELVEAAGIPCDF